MNRIYLDHAATSPLLPEAKKAVMKWLDCGNPSSLYEEGRRARAAIDEAREVLSERLGCLFAEVLFTSGGTEAANMAILGAAVPGKRILVSAAEHHCVLHLASLGVKLEVIPVDRAARVDLAALEKAMGPDVALVSVMHANNELGTINPVAEVAEIAHRHGALYHCDAVQSFGKLDWKAADLGADMITMSAHKIGGPKGVGAIYLRAGVRIRPFVVGGGQEREMRAGTENVAAIAGFAAAVRLTHRAPSTARDRFLKELRHAVPTVAEGVPVLPTHAHVRFPGVPAESLLIFLDRMGVSASSGAACSSGSIEPSHVLLACGFPLEEAKEGVRFTFGPATTAVEAAEAAKRVNGAVEHLQRQRGKTLSVS